MSCNHQFVEQYLFDYVSDRLDDRQRELFLRNAEQCDHCRNLVEDSLSAQHLFSQWQDQDVPDWHRNAYLVRKPETTNSWLNWFSLATSMAAILMVVFKVQLISNESGVHISFGDQQSSQVVEQLVAAQTERLEQEFNQKLTVALSAQRNTTRLMLADWAEKNRRERREDLNFLITGIQTQRLEDQQELDSRLSLIAENQLQNSQFINQMIQSADVNQEQSNDQ